VARARPAPRAALQRRPVRGTLHCIAACVDPAARGAPRQHPRARIAAVRSSTRGRSSQSAPPPPPPPPPPGAGAPVAAAGAPVVAARRLHARPRRSKRPAMLCAAHAGPVPRTPAAERDPRSIATHSVPSPAQMWRRAPAGALVSAARNGPGGHTPARGSARHTPARHASWTSSHRTAWNSNARIVTNGTRAPSSRCRRATCAGGMAWRMAAVRGTSLGAMRTTIAFQSMRSANGRACSRPDVSTQSTPEPSEAPATQLRMLSGSPLQQRTSWWRTKARRDGMGTHGYSRVLGGHSRVLPYSRVPTGSTASAPLAVHLPGGRRRRARECSPRRSPRPAGMTCEPPPPPPPPIAQKPAKGRGRARLNASPRGLRCRAMHA
jgi:hypothetical protein